MLGKGLVHALITVLCCGVSASALAQPGSADAPTVPTPREAAETVTIVPVAPPDPALPELEWRWPKFTLTEWFITGGALATTLVAALVGPNEENPRQGPILLDDEVQSALRIGTRQGRRAIRDMSDVMLAVNTTYPILVDALAIAGFYRRSPEVAKQLALIDAEVYMVSTALTSLAKMIGSRERPYGENCGTLLPEEVHDCFGQGRYTSFFSGHASQTFASAVATCMHHANVPLHGGGPVEMVPCATGLAFATLAGLGRMMGDVHYFSDVMTGAVIGSAVGFLIPWWHYRKPIDTSDDDGITWQLLPTSHGGQVVGTF